MPVILRIFVVRHEYYKLQTHIRTFVKYQVQKFYNLKVPLHLSHTKLTLSPTNSFLLYQIMVSDNFIAGFVLFSSYLKASPLGSFLVDLHDFLPPLLLSYTLHGLDNCQRFFFAPMDLRGRFPKFPFHCLYSVIRVCTDTWFWCWFFLIFLIGGKAPSALGTLSRNLMYILVVFKGMFVFHTEYL